MKFSYFNRIVLLLFIVFTVCSLSAQTNWTKYLENPVIPVGPPGSWDDKIVGTPWIIFDDTTYYMWYVGGDVFNWRIGYATSTDGLNWTKYAGNPVLQEGTDAWEGESVTSPAVIIIDSTYHLWYGGSPSNSTGSIGYATSTNGINWTKYENNPVMVIGKSGTWEEDGIGIGSVLFDGEIFRMWYDGWDDPNSFHIGYATSTDGISWAKHENNPVLDVGSASSWDYPRVEHPKVIYDGATYHMWYAASDWFRGITGYATSPDGVVWTKYEGNPVLNRGSAGSWDDRYAGYCFVLFDSSYGAYKMWYSGGEETTGGGIGYAVDFSTIAHSDSFGINAVYLHPEVDNLEINARIVNPNEHYLTAKAKIVSEDSTVVDSADLVDNGDGLWTGQWTVPAGEKDYRVGIKTIDEESGGIYNGLLWNIEKFTTIGPVNLESYEFTSEDTIPNPDNYLRAKLYLKNNGLVATASNIKIRVTNLDTFSLAGHISVPAYGDIAPGEVAGSNRAIWISISASCPDSFYSRIKVDIYSGLESYWSDTLSIFVVDDPTGFSKEDEYIPTKFALNQNYPNPFNPITVISYQLPVISNVELNIYNVLGEKVATLVSEKQSAGSYKTEWNASNLSSGIYFYVLRAGEFQAMRKMVLIK